jgi:hypothetical protein
MQLCGCRAYTACDMNRRLFRKWAAWLAPLLVLRALLPVGFMLSAYGGSLHLVFCPQQSPTVVAALAATTASHAAHHTADAGADSTRLPATHHGDAAIEIDAPCPYGLVSVAAILDVPRLDADVLRPTDEFTNPPSPVRAGVGPTRSELIRGPPRLS